MSEVCFVCLLINSHNFVLAGEDNISSFVIVSGNIDLELLNSNHEKKAFHSGCFNVIRDEEYLLYEIDIIKENV